MLGALRRLESRGEIRGGRFVEAYLGEQFALPEALDLLRAIRRAGETAARGEHEAVLAGGAVAANGSSFGQSTGIRQVGHS